MVNRLRNDQIVRVPSTERKYGIDELRIYAYIDGKDLKVVGEVIADYILNDFSLTCTVYDQEGDMVESLENYTYGMWYSTRMIKEEVFFNGFPFEFSTTLGEGVEVSKIRIVPD